MGYKSLRFGGLDFLRLRVTNPYVWGVRFLTFEGYKSLRWGGGGLDFLHLRVTNPYVLGVFFLRLRVINP